MVLLSLFACQLVQLEDVRAIDTTRRQPDLFVEEIETGTLKVTHVDQMHHSCEVRVDLDASYLEDNLVLTPTFTTIGEQFCKPPPDPNPTPYWG